MFWPFPHIVVWRCCPEFTTFLCSGELRIQRIKMKLKAARRMLGDVFRCNLIRDKIPLVCKQRTTHPWNEILSPVNDVVSLQIIQGKCQLTDVQFDGSFIKVNILLQMVPQVSSKQEINHHEHVFFILKGIPGRRKYSWDFRSEKQLQHALG